MDKFKSVNTPDKHIAIDEELLLWKGRLGLRQYIPNKRARFGIKMFSVCKVSGYLWNSFVYVGKNANETPEEQAFMKELGRSGAVVPKLMSDLYRNGYNLYVENWYTSERLFKDLSENGTVACGTAIGNRLKISQALKEETLEKGDCAFRRNGNILMVRYKDKKEIYFLSKIHEIKMEKLPTRGRDELSPSKLSLVNYYNKDMEGVDRNDALIGNYIWVRKTFKWTVKVVIHFIEKAVLNAFILFDKTKPGKARFMNFKMELIETTIARARLDSSKDLYKHPPIGTNFLGLVPPTEKKTKSLEKMR